MTNRSTRAGAAACLLLTTGVAVFAADHTPVTTPDRPMEAYVEVPAGTHRG